MKSYLLDACALIAYLDDEKGADKVEELLQSAELRSLVLFIHEINLLEAYYGAFKIGGAELGDRILETVRVLPIELVRGLSEGGFREAGRFKATYRMSLADAVALSEAKTRRCALVTADHHELDAVAAKGEVEFFWIR